MDLIWVGKVKQAGALTGEKPSQERLKPLRLGVQEVERPFGSKSERGAWRWRGSLGGFSWGESLRDPKIPREQVTLTWTKPLGGNEGYGFFGGSNPLERRYKAERFCRKAQGRKVGLGTIWPITEEEKSSEGRSPRVLGAERGFRGCRD